MAQRPPRTGSTPTPRDPEAEKTRDQLPAGNPFAKKYGSRGNEQR
jgi:hypothetical protein